MRIFITLIFILLTFSPRSFASPAASGEGLFVLSPSFDNWKACPQIGPTRCLLSKLKQNETVWLLGQKKSSPCKAYAVKTFESEWEPGSFPLTLINTENCKNFKAELAVRINKPIRYELINSKNLPVPDNAASRTIDLKIRDQALRFEASSPQHQIGLSSRNPILFRLPHMAVNTYIAVYENSLTAGDQVHFIYSQGKVKLIHSAAGISSVFSLDGKYYIHYTFTCRVGCGYVGDLIVEFTKNDFKVVMDDASLST